MIKWIKIDENNKPVFKKQYVLGREKKGFFKPEIVRYGILDRITETTEGIKYIFQSTTDYNEYSYSSDFTHFIEIDDLPKVE